VFIIHQAGPSSLNASARNAVNASNSAENNYSGDGSRQYHPTPEQLKVRKSYRRHQRTNSHGSGNFSYLAQTASPRTSPQREESRRVSCHGTPRLGAAHQPQNRDLPPPYGDVVGSGSTNHHAMQTTSESEADVAPSKPHFPPPKQLPERIPRMDGADNGNDVEVDDVVNSNSIFGRFSRRDSLNSTSDDECVIEAPAEKEIEADDRYLENLDRKVYEIINRGCGEATGDVSGMSRGDRSGSGRTRRSLRKSHCGIPEKVSPGSARRVSTKSCPNNNLVDQNEVVRFDDEDGDADSTDSREEEEEEEEEKAAEGGKCVVEKTGTNSGVIWSDDADDSEEDNPRFMLRRRR
jgi:hypothetical protein